MKRKSDETHKNNTEVQDVANQSERTDKALREKTEEKLRASEERFRLLSEAAEEGIAIHDKGVIIEANQALASMFGYKLSEMIGKYVKNGASPESWKLILKHIDTGNDKPYEITAVRKDGSTFVCSMVGKPYKYKDRTLRVATFRDITECKRTQEALRASEEKYSTLVENATDGVSIIQDKVIKFANRRMAEMSGYTVEELTGMSTFDLVPPDFAPKLSERFSQRERGQSVSEIFNTQMLCKDGTFKEMENSTRIIQYEGKPAVIGIIRDITERKLLEEELKQSVENNRKFFEDHVAPGIIIDPGTGKIIHINHAAAQYYGWTREEMMQMNIAQINTLSREEINTETKKVLLNEKNQFESKHRLADGSVRDVEVFSSMIKIRGMDMIHSITYDITERKRSEELLKQSEAKYRLLADHMKDHVWLMDMNLKWTYISPSMEKLLGYTLDELLQLPLDKFLTEASFPKAMEFFFMEMPKALAAPPSYSLKRLLEFECHCKDGQTLWIESSFSFIRDVNGKPLSVLGEGRNITERKQIEDSLRKSEENFRHSFDESPLGVRISTAEGETIYANSAILDIYGFDSIEELKNTTPKERYTPESYAEFQTRKRKRVRGEFGPSEYEVSIVRKNGELRHLYVFRKQIFWNGKNQSQVIYQDITLRRRAEEKLNEILENLRQSIKTTIQVLGTASEARDPYMAGHQKRVADLARAIATEMKLPHDKIEAIRMAGAIHDIGKISVPSEILCKPAILTDLEFCLIKNHSQYSYEIIKGVESPWPLADIVHQHHERIDGSGYPQGLKDGNILIEARIIAVADVVEAMMSYRPYRPALGIEIALAEVEKNAGTLYDSKAADACLRLFREKSYQMI
ncbi:MAG: PAS domain S-box protein [Deltaproteobacteria bacterium]|nr:PAS domain S-box protein [Deltaproteobacteria bacterium]